MTRPRPKAQPTRDPRTPTDVVREWRELPAKVRGRVLWKLALDARASAGTARAYAYEKRRGTVWQSVNADELIAQHRAESTAYRLAAHLLRDAAGKLPAKKARRG